MFLSNRPFKKLSDSTECQPAPVVIPRQIQIKPLCVRDASFIAANMRAEDFREIACLWQHWDTRALGLCALETAVPGMVWSVWFDGQPAAAFGFSRASAFDPEHWQAWAFGTERFKRCVPLMTRHILGVRQQIERDCRRLQVITLKEHDIAHRWIEALGAKREGLLRSYGRGGEDFWVYAWVRDTQETGAEHVMRDDSPLNINRTASEMKTPGIP